MTTRTRFAPSPTGDLHIGGVRTALYSYLYAHNQGGQFVLRVEDTDLERSTQDSVQAILDGMAWLGLEHDEGPFYQTKRSDRYHEVMKTLLDDGKAYRCYCSKERLTTLRETQMSHKQKPRYDGRCRDLSEPKLGDYVIRFKNPADGDVCFDDEVRGRVVFQNTELDDLIIARTDGSPTYNFTVVVDDWDMKITHVIRGDDHINNTPRQVNILKALGAALPTYAHVPMILGEDGKRLSKRHGAVSVMQYRRDGFLPHALLNYLVRLGWSSGDKEIFSRDEMIGLFDLSSLSKSPAALNTNKLLWLNQHYMKALPVELVAKELAWHMTQQGIDVSQGPALSAVVNLQAERVKTLKDMAERSRFFYEDIKHYDEKAAKKHLTPEATPLLLRVKEQLEVLATWEAEAITAVIHNIAEAASLKMGVVAGPVRVAVTGTAVSPPLGPTLALLGRERTLARLTFLGRV